MCIVGFRDKSGGEYLILFDTHQEVNDFIISECKHITEFKVTKLGGK